VINEIVTCARLGGMTQEEALANQRRRAPAWRAGLRDAPLISDNARGETLDLAENEAGRR
jgi:hypothetical protein